jgi:hypothetical protein
MGTGTIHIVYAHLAKCTDDDPGGRALEVFYTATDEAVTLTSEEGNPLTDSFGLPISKTLAPGDDAASVARNLGLRNFHATRDFKSEFNRPLTAKDYPMRGWR